jgi:signal transduction histidine kinase
LNRSPGRSSPVSKRHSMNHQQEMFFEDKIPTVEKYIQLQLTIEDDGVGISEENIGKLFKDFSKLEEHEEVNKKGTGLGLSICKRLIQKMGGEVSVISNLGKGTKFIIKIQFKVIKQPEQAKSEVCPILKNSFIQEEQENRDQIIS